MLSILIPVYNQKVVTLVNEIYDQCKMLNIDFEILIFDDFSTPRYKKMNQALGFKFAINYMELSENIGRSRIRNWLGTSAKNKFLLFLDCDSKIKSRKFIKRYLEAAEQSKVVYGGTVYNPKPKNKSKILHWTFGQNREVKAPKERNKKPYLSFTSNNFLIDRELFESLLFDESIKGYGYEDLVFANVLKKINQPILHIDNPVIHLGIEKTDVFLKKIDTSIRSLVDLHQQGKLEQTRLIDTYEKFKKYKLIGIIMYIFNLWEDKIMKNLHSEKPNLKYLDLYKLSRYHNAISK